MTHVQEMIAAIKAATQLPTIYVSPRTMARHEQAMALLNEDASKGKRLRISILTKGLRK